MQTVKVYQYGTAYEIAVSIYRSIWNTSEKITHVPECISSSEKKKKSLVFACFDLRQVQKIGQVSSKSSIETQTSQMYIDDSVNAVPE
jgi:hypothetical protein